MRNYTIATMKTQISAVNYEKAIQLARTILNKDNIEICESPPPVVCPGCKEKLINKKQCSCWGYS